MLDASIAPVVKTIRVETSQSRAFEVFTANVAHWWNPARSANPTKAKIADVVIEPREGGRWYERGVDGSECAWGTIVEWRPPSRLTLEWRAGADWPTEVEIEFIAITPDVTEVRLEHRLNRSDETGRLWRERYEQGWGEMLPIFAALAEGERQ